MEVDDKNWLPEIIVIGPAGVRGFIESGPLWYYEKVGFLKSVKTIVGVSVGSLIGALMAIGLNIERIIEITIHLSLFDELRNNSNESLSNISLLSSKFKEITDGYGLLSGKIISDLLRSQMEEKWGAIGKEMTLSNLFNCTGIRLVSTVTNCVKRDVEYFDHLNAPDLKVVDAVLMSSAIPGLFHQKIYKGISYQDGAFGNPYPIDLFDDGKTNILGIYIESIMEHSELNPLSAIYNCVNIHMGIHRKLIMKHASNRVKHIEIKTEISDVVGITLTEETKLEMIRQGWNAGKKFYQELRGIKQKSIVVPFDLPLDKYINQIIKETIDD